jgi:hypothetical protein
VRGKVREQSRGEERLWDVWTGMRTGSDDEIRKKKRRSKEGGRI